MKPNRGIRADCTVKTRKHLRAIRPVKPVVETRATVPMKPKDDRTREEVKQQWRLRMKKQYASYKHKTLHGLVTVYYDGEERRLAEENRLRILREVGGLDEPTIEATDAIMESLKEYEVKLTKKMEGKLETIPVYSNYLSKTKGIGAVYSACLIAWIDDIGRFDTISKLHRYSGLSAIDNKAQKPRGGYSLDYNPKMKTLMYKIGTSFLMSKNSLYRGVYDKARKHYEDRGKYSESNPGGYKNKLHLHLRAMKKMERIFVANLWLAWRKLEGLPVSEPWVFTHGGHDLAHKIADPNALPEERVSQLAKKKHKSEPSVNLGETEGRPRVAL